MKADTNPTRDEEDEQKLWFTRTSLTAEQLQKAATESCSLNHGETKDSVTQKPGAAKAQCGKST